ncbi:hypothetical protein ACFXPS_43385 [Nocardia sp. NPDC059091]|uniref:hypothetical protein n=1 Tax=unclassified Nocardia TaxID=2637762 RepID=UPI0036CB3D58
MYKIIPHADTFDQVAGLPSEALDDYTQVLSVLQVAPWNGQPQNAKNPDGAVRVWLFGPGKAGQVVYLVLDEPPEVHILMVMWIG